MRVRLSVFKSCFRYINTHNVNAENELLVKSQHGQIDAFNKQSFDALQTRQIHQSARGREGGSGQSWGCQDLRTLSTATPPLPPP